VPVRISKKRRIQADPPVLPKAALAYARKIVKGPRLSIKFLKKAGIIEKPRKLARPYRLRPPTSTLSLLYSTVGLQSRIFQNPNDAIRHASALSLGVLIHGAVRIGPWSSIYCCGANATVEAPILTLRIIR
jgi:hypothetical protein